MAVLASPGSFHILFLWCNMWQISDRSNPCDLRDSLYPVLINPFQPVHCRYAKCCRGFCCPVFWTIKKARTKSGPFFLCLYYANYYANLCQYAVILDNIVITPVNAFNGCESRINTEKNSPCQQMTEAVENVTGLAGFEPAK